MKKNKEISKRIIGYNKLKKRKSLDQISLIQEKLSKNCKFVKDNFYITDHGNHRIIKMNLSGKAISWIGENTIKSNSMIWNKNGFSIKSNSPIGLNHPFGLKIKNKKIYIADRGNNRIKVIKSNLIN